MKQMEFCLVTGNSLPEALQQLPGTLQQISKGKEFDICAMMCVPEMVAAAGGLVNPGRQQPRYQVSIVIAVKYEVAEDLPGMGSAPGSDYINENRKHGLVQPGYKKTGNQ